MHKFDVSERQKLDKPKRRALLPPEETLRKLGVEPGEIMADIGCGIGYFTFPAAFIIGPEGKVHALDVSSEMLAEVETKKAQSNADNIDIVKVDEYDFKLKSESITFGFVCNVLHEVDEPAKFLHEIKRISESKGKMVIIEWEKRVSDFGPPIEHRMDKNDAIKALEIEGFINIEALSLGDEFYAVKAQKG